MIELSDFSQPKEEARKGLLFVDLVDLFIESRRALNLRPTTLINYRSFAGRAKAVWGDRESLSVTKADFVALVGSHGYHYAGEMQVLLRWAYRTGVLPVDVTHMALPTRPRYDEDPIVYLTPSEAQRVLAAASVEFRPALVLAMFAGLRPYEICRLDWSAINIKERRIRVSAQVSKIRRHRLIESVPAILWAQLQPHEQRSGAVIRSLKDGGPNVARWIELRRQCGKVSRVHLSNDVFRHTFATYHVALNGNPANTARILGHHDLYMLASHYDGVATKQDAEDYFHPRPILALPYGGPRS